MHADMAKRSASRRSLPQWAPGSPLPYPIPPCPNQGVPQHQEQKKDPGGRRPQEAFPAQILSIAGDLRWTRRCSGHHNTKRIPYIETRLGCSPWSGLPAPGPAAGCAITLKRSPARAQRRDRSPSQAPCSFRMVPANRIYSFWIFRPVPVPSASGFLAGLRRGAPNWGPLVHESRQGDGVNWIEWVFGASTFSHTIFAHCRLGPSGDPDTPNRPQRGSACFREFGRIVVLRWSRDRRCSSVDDCFNRLRGLGGGPIPVWSPVRDA